MRRGVCLAQQRSLPLILPHPPFSGHQCAVRSPKLKLLLQEQPSWPSATALQKLRLPLQRYTVHMMFSKKWFPRFYVLANGRLHYSDGNNGHPDSKEGTLALVRSKPAPDTRYCVDLRGICAVAACIIALRR